MKKPRIGITGASGFIGRHLIDKLLRQDYPVIAFSRKKNLNLPSKVKVINGDLRSGRGLILFLKNTDILIHLAAIVLPSDEETFEDNVVGTYKLITEALKHAIKQIIFTSSVAVYGNCKRGKLKEGDFCLPGTEYGLSKYLAEKIVLYWSKMTGNPSTILRPVNVYGSGNTKGIIYNFYSDIKNKKQVTIYGNGKQERDFLYVDDAIELILNTIEKKSNGVFDIGFGKNYSVIKLLKKFEKILDRKIPVTFKPAEIGNVYNISPDVAKTEKVIGWKAKMSLDEGLKATIFWYEKNL